MFEAFQTLFTPPRHMILLVMATWLGLLLAERRTDRYGISKDDLNNITFYGLIAFIIGGRIFYVLQNVSAFSKSPLGIVSINPDLFDPFGALAAAFVVTLVYGQRKQLSFWNILDALTPFFAVILISLGLSHLAEGIAFGLPTDLPWGINLWNATRHPVQLYDALASSLILILLWLFKPNPRPGIHFLLFTILLSLSQLILQAFRANYIILFNGLRQEQILAWLALLVGFIFLEIRLNAAKKPTSIKKNTG
jgi:phosphatidylglycerol---prolipoprotein diacylglyceryl transferase